MKLNSLYIGLALTTFLSCGKRTTSTQEILSDSLPCMALNTIDGNMSREKDPNTVLQYKNTPDSIPGIILQPEYTVYSIDAPSINFILINASDTRIELRRFERMEYLENDNDKNWIPIPYNEPTEDTAISLSSQQQGQITFPLYPQKYHYKQGKYRILYNIWIPSIKREFTLCSNFSLTDNIRLSAIRHTEKLRIKQSPLSLIFPLREPHKEDNHIYHIINEMPSFPKGMKACMTYINTSISSYMAVNKNNTKGTVVLQFIIEKNGTISNPIILKSLSTELDKEALRIIRNMPHWKPGRIDNQPKRVYYTLPVTFKS